jgi:hypothetical protein
VAGGRLAVARQPRVDTYAYQAIPNFLNFLNFKKKSFWKFGKWARAFERMVVQHPHYLKLAPTLGSANSSKIHGELRFHFFPKKTNPKFRTHLDLHIYRWDFCFMKK